MSKHMVRGWMNYDDVKLANFKICTRNLESCPATTSGMDSPSMKRDEIHHHQRTTISSATFFTHGTTFLPYPWLHTFHLGSNSDKYKAGCGGELIGWKIRQVQEVCKSGRFFFHDKHIRKPVLLFVPPPFTYLTRSFSALSFISVGHLFLSPLLSSTSF